MKISSGIFHCFTHELIVMENKDITVQSSYKLVKLITIVLLLYVIIFYSAV